MARQIEMNFFSAESAPAQIHDLLDYSVDSSDELNSIVSPILSDKKPKTTGFKKISLKKSMDKLSHNSE